MSVNGVLRDLHERATAATAAANHEPGASAPGIAASPAPPPAAPDPKALEALLKVDFVDYAGYHVGAQIIPKGRPAEQHLKSFQAAQREIGGSEQQLQILGEVRAGRLPADKLPDEHPSASQLLKAASVDRNGDLHLGNLTVRKDAVEGFKHALTSQELRDPQLVPSVVKLALDGRPQTIDAADLGANGPGKVTALAQERTHDAEAHKILAGVPDRIYGTLAQKEIATERERLTDTVHVGLAMGPHGEGALRGPGVYLAGKIERIESRDGITTCTYEERGRSNAFSYKHPLGVDSAGREFANPLHAAIENARPGDAFKVQVAADGVGLASQISRDGAPRHEYQTGTIAPMWEKTPSQSLGRGV